MSKVRKVSAMEYTAEVRGEPAKKLSAKRERVKIRITNASSGSLECEVVQNQKDLIDKTPSPLCNARRTSPRNNGTPCSKKHFIGEKESTSNGVKDDQPQDINSAESYDSPTTETSNNLLKMKKKTIKDNVTALANKKGFEKRKRKEIQEDEEIENSIKEKKKVFTEESKKVYSNNGNIANGQKRASCSLLNYFSKATPEQIQKEKMTMTKIVVKAEIHQMENEKVISSNINTTQKLKSKQKKKLKDIKAVLLSADEIEVLSSENISSPPSVNENVNSTPEHKSPFNNNVTPKLNKTPKNKPKWSMKIKLNSNEDSNDTVDVQDFDSIFDENIFTPRSRVKDKNDCNKSKEKCEDKSGKKDNLKLKKEKSSKSSAESPEKLKKTTKPSKSEPPFAKDKSSASPSAKEAKPDKTSPKSTKVEKLAPIFMRRSSSLKENDDGEIKIVEETLKRKPEEKLAPLFVKRRKPDPEVLAARRQFLQPEVVDLTDRPVKVPPPPPVLFPKISHVTQLEKGTEKPALEPNFTLKPVVSYEPVLRIEELKFVNSSNTITSVIETKLEEITDAETELVVNEIESRFENAGVIWNRISKLGRKTRSVNGEVKKKKKGRPKKNAVEVNAVVENVEEDAILKEMVWTNKYKPTSSKEVIGNEEAVQKLKEWLESWRKKAVDKEQSDSDDDFCGSDSSRSSFVGRNQVAVLMGPHGCGKTSSIYAVAEELDYKVIEVNASSKRPGKKILKDLEEATKSHRIRNQSIETFGFGAIKKSSEKSISKNSLILFDDIDLVFEEDDGFMNATFQLASNTKRPIAMTCKSSFPQLSKFAPQQLRINFYAIPSKKASAYLELVSLAEARHKLPVSCAEALTITGDLRKALLQLQYLLLSGKALSTSVIENPRPSMWKDAHNGLYRPVIKAAKSYKKKQTNEVKERTKEKKAERDAAAYNALLLENMANDIDRLSLVSSLVARRDVALDRKTHVGEDGLSLLEKMNDYSSSNALSSEILEWITEKTLQKNASMESKDIANLDKLLQEKSINEGVNMVLAQTVASTLDPRAISTDYLPYVRAICRTEEIRQNNNAKRGNRFYHYLQGIVTVRPHSFTAACKMLQEKSKDKT